MRSFCLLLFRFAVFFLTFLFLLLFVSFAFCVFRFTFLWFDVVAVALPLSKSYAFASLFGFRFIVMVCCAVVRLLCCLVVWFTPPVPQRTLHLDSKTHRRHNTHNTRILFPHSHKHTHKGSLCVVYMIVCTLTYVLRG